LDSLQVIDLTGEEKCQPGKKQQQKMHKPSLKLFPGKSLLQKQRPLRRKSP
jgi:hypothetical protein